MRGLLKHVVSEPGAESAEGFARRVRILGATYLVLFCASCAGAVVVALHGKLFVTLAQRSNVETLTILFMLVFYAYLAAISARGALGAVRIALYALRRRLAGDSGAERRRQLRALGKPGDGPWAAIAKVLERADGVPLRFELPDPQGSHGRIEVDGARISQLDARNGGSADLLAYFVRQVAEVAGQDLPIVAWGQLDDDEGERFLAQVEFARALRRQLGCGPLWPTLSLESAQCEEIAARLQRIAPALLEEALLPDWEYEAEHKLPVIPEPLGLVSLCRTAKRADPVATMGFATAMVLLTLAVALLFVLDKPWVPG
jgi:hypothetical protein